MFFVTMFFAISDGNTALFLAIEKNNVKVVKLLCSKGADINTVNDKNGFVPLRCAIEKQSYDITRYLLSLPDIQPLTTDFGNITPLQAGLQKSKPISDLVQNYMASIAIFMFSFTIQLQYLC